MRIKLYTVALLCGACVMIIELVGSRMTAPFLGSSIIVWTSLIGVIMASMAVGYYAGGRFADARPSSRFPAAFIAGAALWVFVLAFAGRFILRFLLYSGIGNMYILSVAASFLLFAVPAFLLAAVSPFIVKLLSADTKAVGSIAGKVSACSTAGGIAGTFLGGFVLVSFFSVTAILLITGLVLFVTAIALFSASRTKTVALVSAVLFVFATLFYSSRTLLPVNVVETLYNSVVVAEYEEDGRINRALLTDSEKIQGRMFVDNPEEMAAPYQRFAAANFIGANTKSVLVLGGGIYVLPRYLASVRPDIAVDTVEIDPGITETARRFFYLPERENHRIFHEDARYFINRMSRGEHPMYDFILQDVYGSALYVPFHLTSVEYLRAARELLNEDGIFALNFLGSLDSAMFAGLYASVAEVFPGVRVFPIENPHDTKTLQSIVFVTKKNGAVSTPESGGAPRPEIAKVFTDVFAPVERYTLQMIQESM